MTKSEEELRQVAMDFAWPELKGRNKYNELSVFPKKHIDDFVAYVLDYAATVAAEARKEQIMQDFFAYSEEIDDSEDKLIEVRDDLLAALSNTQPEKEKKD